MLDHITMSLFLMIVFLFFGRVFGGIRVPLRVTFFTWSATSGKLLAMDNLRKRHIIVVDWCCMCKKSGELVDHLLLNCQIATALWNVIFNCVGLAWGYA
jgi:hypothetical protein